MKYNNLTPFKWCIIENFPFIEADFDAITNYQLLCKVVEYLNKTIDSTNVLGQKVQEFAEYFENLDVQEEINKKLDDLVNDGTISKLLNEHIINLQNEINNLKVTKRNKNNLIGMQDLTQEVKEAMTGGSVAVVGKLSVNSANIQNHSITPNKLNFVDVFDKNLLDISLVNDYYYDFNGDIIENGNYVSSDFIDIGDYVVNDTTFHSNMANGNYVLFDESMNFIKIVGTNKSLNIDIENVKFIKMNILKTLPQFNNLYLIKDNAINYKNYIVKAPYHDKNDFITINTDNLIGNSISPSHTNFITRISNNMFNKYLADKHGYFSNNGFYYNNIESGNLTNYGSYIMQLSAYIPNETTFYQDNGTGYINFYDSDMNFLGGLSSPNVKSFTIPYENVVYITKSLLISEFDSYYLIQGTDELVERYELDENIKINNLPKSILENKKIGFLGDSITYGLGVSKPYPQVIQDKTNCISINYGISGNSIAKAGNGAQQNAIDNPMCVRYSQMDDELDYILVFGGTNDYAYQTPIGEKDSFDITTFNGGLNTLISGLIEKYPGKPILFLTPLYRTLSHENGYKFLDYRNAIIERCNYYSIPVFNLTDNSTIKSLIDTINQKYYVNQDRLHPNEAGQEIIGRIIQHQLEII